MDDKLDKAIFWFHRLVNSCKFLSKFNVSKIFNIFSLLKLKSCTSNSKLANLFSSDSKSYWFSRSMRKKENAELISRMWRVGKKIKGWEIFRNCDDCWTSYVEKEFFDSCQMLKVYLIKDHIGIIFRNSEKKSRMKLSFKVVVNCLKVQIKVIRLDC